jgi:PAS domain S-box-containing protein
VCRIEVDNEWFPGEEWRANSFNLLTRSAGDVVLLKAPPWWTLKKMLWMVGALGLIVLLGSAWVAILRRRVSAQTEIIRQKLEVEATLKERYVDLFENANDVVYTHDLAGRITSINETGERLLERKRGEILSRNLIEFIVPEEQPAAMEWLQTVLKGIPLPIAEWDFKTASGQRVKLEISTRSIEQGGRLVEVEGIARDITERKRLEREILEISNREQRRIGHDLHDGICQLLAGIAFKSECLAHVLEKNSSKEYTEAEKLCVLINTAINQTRSVARGLFPVRLEENGLASALTELAANARELYGINCQFLSRQPPARISNETALHLYYIVLEAVSNASKHGLARNIIIGLEPASDGCVLSVNDDGVGFSTAHRTHTGMGIRIMHYRARVIGASLSLESAPDYGTQLRCLFPPVSLESHSEFDRSGSEKSAQGNGVLNYAAGAAEEKPYLDR